MTSSTPPPPPPPAFPDGDWPTFGYDAARSADAPAATGITARNVGLLRRRMIQLDGTVDSAPIELRGVTVRGRTRDVAIVTTTYGRTIAFDPGTGAQLWEYVPSDIGSYQRTAQVTTATPVADPGRRYVYTASPDGVIHKLALATGAEVRGGKWPVTITFDPTREKLAGALNVSGGEVVAVTGGYFGDAPSYQGHVAMIDRATGRIAHVWNSLCSDRNALIDPPSSCSESDSAIWAREGAVIEPGSRRILVATGNGTFDGGSNWGDSVLELAPDGSSLLHNWTPTDQAQLNAGDTDVGSTAPALLPGGLAVQGGKDGNLQLLDLHRLDGSSGPAGSTTGGELQTIPAPGGAPVFTAPAVWTHRPRTFLFVADNSGTSAYALNGRRLSVAWQNATPGTSPVLAGGLLYIYDQINGHLTIRNPASGALLASLPAGTGHWNSPIVAGGRVIVAEGSYMAQATSGVVDVYHLPGR